MQKFDHDAYKRYAIASNLKDSERENKLINISNAAYYDREFKLDMRQLVKMACNLARFNFQEAKRQINAYLGYSVRFQNTRNENINDAYALVNRGESKEHIEKTLFPSLERS